MKIPKEVKDVCEDIISNILIPYEEKEFILMAFYDIVIKSQYKGIAVEDFKNLCSGICKKVRRQNSAINFKLVNDLREYIDKSVYEKDIIPQIIANMRYKETVNETTEVY